jgi:hypothetical protein
VAGMTDTDFNLGSWPPEGCPPLEWPDLPDQDTRFRWYLSVIQAYSLLWDVIFAPVSADVLTELELQLKCPLPESLRKYHKEIGVLDLSERLCSAVAGNTPIQPLLDAFPGLSDITESKEDFILSSSLIVFGDYLGNGNMFCFHRENGEVYYFDHDSGPLLTRFFSTVEQYLDALMVRCLSEIYENDEEGEKLLVEKFGPVLVRKWLY